MDESTIENHGWCGLLDLPAKVGQMVYYHLLPTRIVADSDTGGSKLDSLSI